MPQKAATQRLTTEEVCNFLSRTDPFSELPRKDQEELASLSWLEHYPAGQRILDRDRSEVTHLRLIYNGRVRMFLEEEEGKVGMEIFRGRGEGVGILGILLNSRSNLDVEAVDETDCLLIPKAVFLELVQKHTALSRYYMRAIAEGYVSRALSELKRPKPVVSTEGSLFLFSAQVGDVVRRRPEYIPQGCTVREAAKVMNERRVGYLLVGETEGKAAGIITDRDLRTKVVGAGRGSDIGVEEVMSSPVRTVPARALCFDVLLEMVRSRVHHLAIAQDGRITGVVSGHDLMVLQGTSPLFLVREIATAERIEELYDLSLKSPRVVSSLIHEGAKASHVTRMITLLNDYVLDRLLTLLQQELGPPPVPFCWLLMGSEGRKEQTFRTDQDNGLLYRDPEGDAQRKEAADYFRMLGNETIRHLVSCGFPRCKGDIMASNPKWCQPLSAWKRTFERWVNNPEPREVMHATIFFDFRPGYGDLSLGQELRAHLNEILSGQELFFRFLAQDCLKTPAALNFFRQFVTEKSGQYKNRVDLKTKGITPFVDFARLTALRAKVNETNTLERLQQAGDLGGMSEELQMKAMQSFEFQMQLRLVHQWQMHEEGLEPDNFIDPNQLSDLDRHTLKDAFAVVSEIKGHLREEYRLG